MEIAGKNPRQARSIFARLLKRVFTSHLLVIAGSERPLEPR